MRFGKYSHVRIGERENPFFHLLEAIYGTGITIGSSKDICGFSMRRLPASGNKDPVFRPFTNSDQYSYQQLLCHMDISTFS